MCPRKVVVIGLDAADWSFLMPWINDGKLPTFKKLLEGGTWSELWSTLPPVTFPAWKCYSTGKNPGKLNVFWWLNVDFKKEKIGVNSSTSFKSKEIWDYLGKEDIRVGIINMPSTYPPKKVNGFMISGFPSFEDWSYVYPSRLKEELRKKFRYKVNPRHHIHVYKEEATQEIDRLIKLRFDVAQEYLDIVDFMHLTIFYIDDVQHFFWNRKDVILKLYQTIDVKLSELIKKLGRKGIVLLISDHGFTGLKDIFYMNEWLVRKKLLVKKSSYLDWLSRLGLKQDTLVHITKRVFPLIFEIMPKNVYSKLTGILPRAGYILKEGLQEAVDWKNSLALALAEGPIYIDSRKFHTRQEYEDFREILIHELKKIEHPVRKEKIIRKVYKREEIYFGEFLENAPDLIVLPNDGYEIDMALKVSGRGKLWGCEAIETEKVFNKWLGHHRLNGVFLAYGEGMKKGAKIRKVTIYDIAPTILHIYGLPIANDIDGRVLTEIFESNSDFTRRRAVYLGSEKAKAKMRVKKLKRRRDL